MVVKLVVPAPSLPEGSLSNHGTTLLRLAEVPLSGTKAVLNLSCHGLNPLRSTD